MGWNLCSRKNRSEFSVLMYDWPRLCMALQAVGADITRMAEYNDGSYVPARVAESWAKSLERGIDSLKMVIVKDRYCQDGTGYLIVPSSCDEECARRLVKEYYRGRTRKKDGDAVSYLRIEPLSGRMKKYLLDFAKFCRKSKGFEQW